MVKQKVIYPMGIIFESFKNLFNGKLKIMMEGGEVAELKGNVADY